MTLDELMEQLEDLQAAGHGPTPVEVVREDDEEDDYYLAPIEIRPSQLHAEILILVERVSR